MIVNENGMTLRGLVLGPWNGNDHAYSVQDPEQGKTLLGTAVEKVAPASTTTSHQSGTTQPPQTTLELKKTSKSPSIAPPNLPPNISPNSILVLVKTGSTSLWRRLPMHLSTTLSSPLLTPNIAIYSDSPSYILSHPIIDVLANTSSSLKASPDLELYRKALDLQDTNLYLESGSMEGDFYLPGGWRLDKYKFLPLVQHAANEWKGKGIKWYVYMEDDNYYFWPQLYAWLASFDSSKPYFLGSPAFRLGEDFAHGGSGFIISQAAMDLSFGKDAHLADKYESYAAERCCGDQVLSHVLHEHGVERYIELDGTGWAGLQSLPFWRIGFGGWNWCSPILNVHKVHQEDVSKLWRFERWFEERVKGEKGSDGVMRYRDVFENFLLPSITREAERVEWDNFASAREHSSSRDQTDGVVFKGMKEEERVKRPWYSKEACKKACEEWGECLSWRYADDNCGLGNMVSLGHRVDEGIRKDSGWMVERLERLTGKVCEGKGY